MRIKSIIAIFVALLLSFNISACASEGNQEETASSAINASASEGNQAETVKGDQKAFLESMAQGLKDRKDAIDDEAHANDTPEQRAEYYKMLVSCELNHIEEYENVVFDDKKFDDLAHFYIQACQIQFASEEYYRDEVIFSNFWSAGRDIRAAIIMTMYENYGLPISSEMASQYYPEVTYTITYDMPVVQTPQPTDPPIIDSSLFEVKEYYIERFGNTYLYLVIKNNSDAAAKISCTATAKDEAGNIIGASNFGIALEVEPGEESIEDLRFDGLTGIDDVEYELSYAPATRNTPLGNIEAEAFINNNNVVIQLTNNGESSASIEGYVLFFDGNGTLVDVDNGYFSDGEFEIKAGATIVEQFDTDAYFDYIEVYFSGYLK